MQQNATMPEFVKKIDDAFQGTWLARFFEMEERKTKFSIELQGAMATFMSMAYILAVNPRILADSGGPCVPDPDTGGIFGDDYVFCQEQVCTLLYFRRQDFYLLYIFSCH